MAEVEGMSQTPCHRRLAFWIWISDQLCQDTDGAEKDGHWLLLLSLLLHLDTCNYHRRANSILYSVTSSARGISKLSAALLLGNPIF